MKTKVDPVVEILESEPVKAMMDARDGNSRLLDYVTTNHGVSFQYFIHFKEKFLILPKKPQRIYYISIVLDGVQSTFE